MKKRKPLRAVSYLYYGDRFEPRMQTHRFTHVGGGMSCKRARLNIME